MILTTPTLHEKVAKHNPYNASVLTSCTVHNNLNLLKLIQRKSGGGALASPAPPPGSAVPANHWKQKNVRLDTDNKTSW